MTNKDDNVVRALIKGTENHKIQWMSVSAVNFKQLREAGEIVEDAYGYWDNKSRRIIIYKVSSFVINPYDGEEVEKVNIYLGFTKGNSYKPDFTISDSDLDNSSLMWTLYKLVKRNESGADLIINDIIKEFGDPDDDLPF
ncbi:hypothetical protein [Peribacillus asahii]|uniref:hypothetical protein n=1 Tax=Peribacillus asahii TaxID=228899 RepID=UPI003828EE85